MRGLKLYGQAGFNTAEALASATIATACLVGADDRIGAIAKDKVADLVLGDGNPETDISDLRRTEFAVMDRRHHGCQCTARRRRILG